MRSEGPFSNGSIALKLSIGEKLTRPEALAHVWRQFEYDHNQIAPAKKWKESFNRFCGRYLPSDVAGYMVSYHGMKQVRSDEMLRNKFDTRTTAERGRYIKNKFLAKCSWLGTMMTFDEFRVDPMAVDTLRLDGNQWVVPRNFLSMFRTEKAFDERFVFFIHPKVATKCVITSPEYVMEGKFKVMWAITPDMKHERVIIGIQKDFERAVIMGELNNISSIAGIHIYPHNAKVAVPITYFRGLKCEENSNTPKPHEP